MIDVAWRACRARAFRMRDQPARFGDRFVIRETDRYRRPAMRIASRISISRHQRPRRRGRTPTTRWRAHGSWSAAVGRANPFCRRVAFGRGRSAGREHAIQVSRDESVSVLRSRASREGFIDRSRVPHVQSASVPQVRTTGVVRRSIRHSSVTRRSLSKSCYAHRRCTSRISILEISTTRSKSKGLRHRSASQIRYAHRRSASRINISSSASAPTWAQAASTTAWASFGG